MLINLKTNEEDKMRPIIFTFIFATLIIILVPTHSFAAEQIDFPEEGYTLHVAITYIEIYGPDFPQITQDRLIAGVARNSMEMASRNAWVAILLNAVATGKQVYILYATTETEAKEFGIGTVLRPGTIIAVGTK